MHDGIARAEALEVAGVGPGDWMGIDSVTRKPRAQGFLHGTPLGLQREGTRPVRAPPDDQGAENPLGERRAKLGSDVNLHECLTRGAEGLVLSLRGVLLLTGPLRRLFLPSRTGHRRGVDSFERAYPSI